MQRYFHTFQYDGKFLSDLGAVIAQKPTFPKPEPDVEFVSLPGKSGDGISDNKRYKNVELLFKIRAVPAFCNLTVDEFSEKLSEWLQVGKCEYKEFRETYNKGYYRKAFCTKISDIIAVTKRVYEATITFNCEPFLYQVRGREELSYQTGVSSIALTNPEEWNALPILKVTGSGAFTISVNSNSFEITLNGTQITIDKPNEDVYYTNTGISCNDKISALALPYFQPGENIIAISTESGTNFSMSIIPNWRRL